MSPEADLLKEVPLFNLLDDQERSELATQLELARFTAGQVVFNYGDPGDSLYVVSEGEFEVFCKNDTGERMVLEVPIRGDFFGELSLLDNGTRSASVAATQDNPALVEEHCGRARLAMIEVAARNSPYYRALFADLFGPGYAPEQVLDAAYWTRINVASRFGTRAHSVIPPSPDGCSVAPYRPVATSTTTALTVEKRL